MGLPEKINRTEGMISVEEAMLLRDLARGVEQGCIVEIGSYRGRSTVALAAGASVPVYAIDPHEEFEGVLGARFGPADREAFYRTMLRTGAVRRVRLVNLPSAVASSGWTQPVGLLFIDGDHRYRAVREDLESWSPHLSADARVAFDDSTDPALGPRRVIEEAVRDGFGSVERVVGKVTVLRRLTAPGTRS